MNNIRNHIYLAAMLHDIGKFYQRADTGSVATSEFLKAYCKDESAFCPLYKGKYSHKHVLWTAQFIEDFQSVFKNLLGSDHADLSDRNNLMNLAAGHHLQAQQLSDLGSIIKEADCLSSGMDREDSAAFVDDQEETNWDAFKKKRMTPILQTISQEVKDWWHLPVCKMTLNKSSFPRASFSDAPDYKTLWKEFVSEFKFIQANTYHAFSETLLNLLYKFTTNIPSSTINFPDISLYDHLKTTAALAVCLYDVKESGESPKERFLLVGADFSGIQPYIYDIVSKHAGKNLKGRSFFLRILSDAVVRFLLKKLRLYQANVIYNSGGGFYLLAPNTSAVRERLKKAIEIIESHFFNTFSTSLYVAIDQVPLSDDALMHRNGESLGKVWGELFLRRDKKKHCRYSTLMKDQYDSFFTPFCIGGNTKRDVISGEEFGTNEQAFSESGLSPLKAGTKDQIYMGKVLREYDVMVVSEEKLPYWNDRHPIQPADLGFFYYFLKYADLDKMKNELRASADKVSVVTPNGELGNCDFLGRIDGINNVYSLDFYGGNELVTKKVPTFEEMCEKHDTIDGQEDYFQRLGVLRMDVDNLGSIFQQGITPERATLSRYTALSRSFEFFFSGYLNEIWRNTAPDKSLIIYSGGDDVFIVGSWEVTIEITKRIKQDFCEFTCHNPAFSISGGIAVVDAKFPIMKGAELSAGEEHNAKEHICCGSSKNSVSFLSMALNWEKEYPAVESLKEQLVNMYKNDILPKSFIAKVLNHHYNSDITNHRITNYKLFWMLTYDLSRMKGRMMDESTKAMIDNCIAEICRNNGKLNGVPVITDYHPLELWALACRWAELEIRTKQ